MCFHGYGVSVRDGGVVSGGVQNKDPLEVVREEVEVQVERFWGKETNLASITVATRCNFTTNLFKFNP